MDDYKVNLKDYKNIKQIGSGSFGAVFLVENSKTKIKYAAKVSHKEYKQEEGEPAFLNEVKMQINLNNPAILKLMGFSLYNFSKAPFPTIILEYMPNGSLAEMLEKCRRGIAPHEWTNTKMYINLLGIALGMEYLHSQQTVQRDLKPLNVLLDENYYPRISDFGLSKKLNELNSMNFMSTGVGTIIYMAPEILSGSPYNYKVDVYAYSIIAYELITSQSPISDGENAMSFVIKVPNGKRPDISMLTDQNQIDFLKKCWSGDPSERPTFSQIVSILKDKEFYSKFDVDEDEIFDYLELFKSETEKSIEAEVDKVPTEKMPLPPLKKMKPRKIIVLYNYRVVLVGDPCTEKNKIIDMFIKERFNDWEKTTTTGYISTPSGDCNLQIWDSAGPEKFRSLFPLYLRNASAIIITANANIEDQFNSLQKWFNLVNEVKDRQDTLIVIAKVHSYGKQCIDDEKMKIFASEHKIPFFDLMLESSESINYMFTDIANNLLKNNHERKNTSKSISILDEEEERKKSCLIF